MHINSVPMTIRFKLGLFTCFLNFNIANFFFYLFCRLLKKRHLNSRKWGDFEKIKSPIQKGGYIKSKHCV